MRRLLADSSHRSSHRNRTFVLHSFFSAPEAACEPSLAEELRVNQGKKTNACTGFLRALIHYVQMEDKR